LDIEKILSEKQSSVVTAIHDFSREDFNALCSSGVYIFAKDNEALYVGSSNRMMNRASNPKHLSALKAAVECTKVFFLPCPSPMSARIEEYSLIRALRPKYNIQGNVDE